MSWKAIAVVGSGKHDMDICELARYVGRLIAESGYAVVCGGLGGVMEAACKGAKEAGGMTIGILPGKNPQDANPYVDIPICTAMGEARNTLVVRCATESVIAIGGEFGTLSEIGFALKIGKRVVGLKTWELAKAGALNAAINVANTPEEAVRLAIKGNLA